MHGTFITFEGIDGCGKSTQAKLLAGIIRATGRNVLEIREPGSTVLAERIRTVLLDPDMKNLNPTAELMLYVACRAQLVNEIIRPALECGDVVISDRYGDSSVAYQGYGRSLGADIVRDANVVGTGNLIPDLTFIVDVPVDTAAARRAGTTADRIEQEKRDFHERVRNGYLEIARREPERVAVVDGTPAAEDVHGTIVAEMHTRMSGFLP